MRKYVSLHLIFFSDKSSTSWLEDVSVLCDEPWRPYNPIFSWAHLSLSALLHPFVGRARKRSIRISPNAQTQQKSKFDSDPFSFRIPLYPWQPHCESHRTAREPRLQSLRWRHQHFVPLRPSSGLMPWKSVSTPPVPHWKIKRPDSGASRYFGQFFGLPPPSPLIVDAYIGLVSPNCSPRWPRCLGLFIHKVTPKGGGGASQGSCALARDAKSHEILSNEIVENFH